MIVVAQHDECTLRMTKMVSLILSIFYQNEKTWCIKAKKKQQPNKIYFDYVQMKEFWPKNPMDKVNRKMLSVNKSQCLKLQCLERTRNFWKQRQRRRQPQWKKSRGREDQFAEEDNRKHGRKAQAHRQEETQRRAATVRQSEFKLDGSRIFAPERIEAGIRKSEIAVSENNVMHQE